MNPRINVPGPRDRVSYKEMPKGYNFESMNIIKRYAAPHKMDQHPKGTICIVNSMLHEKRELWEQTSENWEDPHWELIDERDDIPSDS